MPRQFSPSCCHIKACKHYEATYHTFQEGARLQLGDLDIDKVKASVPYLRLTKAVLVAPETGDTAFTRHYHEHEAVQLSAERGQKSKATWRRKQKVFEATVTTKYGIARTAGLNPGPPSADKPLTAAQKKSKGICR